jgi:hypothetical protein
MYLWGSKGTLDLLAIALVLCIAEGPNRENNRPQDSNFLDSAAIDSDQLIPEFRLLG